MNARHAPINRLPVVPGIPYTTDDTVLRTARELAFDRCSAFNQLPPAAHTERTCGLNELLAKAKGVQVASVFHVEYGINTHIGKGTFLNHHVYFIDACPIHIGNQVLIGPNTVISSVEGRFSIGPEQHQESAHPVSIGHRVWIGANVRIAAGVTIGDNCVIGAGSLVTESLPANTLAYGRPATVIRKIEQNAQ